VCNQSVQKQIERDVGSSVINHWLVDQVKNTLIPVLSLSTQNKISEKVSESFGNREKSKKLLSVAKSAVEVAIEESEEKAIKFLDSSLCSE